MYKINNKNVKTFVQWCIIIIICKDFLYGKYEIVKLNPIMCQYLANTWSKCLTLSSRQILKLEFWGATM